MRSCSLAFAVAAALAGCHDASSSPTRAPSGARTESPTMTDFAPLPPPPDVPTAAQIADAIAAGVPTAQRARATDVLGQQIVPWQLRGVATFPKPRRLAEVVYENLVTELTPVAADQRGAHLEVIACRTTGEKLLGDAMGLAIARWLVDHPGKAAPAPWDEAAKPWAGRTIAQLGAEADARLAQVEQLTKEKTGDCREAMRLSLVHARMALGSTKTGSFATAAGSMVDFLRSVGEPPQVLDIH
jgi:hypothetical protein